MAMQNGWITAKGLLLVSAIVVGSGLLIGGLYYVQERGETARRDEAVRIAQEQLEDEASEVVTGDDTSEEGSAAGSSSGSSSEDSEGSTGAAGGTSGDDSATEAGAAAGELPETGSELTALVAVAVMAFAASSYVTSRRRLQQAITAHLSE